MPSLALRARSYAQIRAQLGELPSHSGVYLFHDRAGRLLYIGKSVCLRQRVRSYFGQAAGRCRKLRGLRRRVGAVEWTETGSELEALLLESRLVKERHPPFNALLHRHRHLVFLRLDGTDPFPRFEVTESLRRDGARYFGPLVLTADAERLADILSDTLRLRMCDPPGDRVHRFPPCLRRDLGLCLAPCVPPADSAGYAAAVRSAVQAFEREGRGLRERLRAEMEDAAARLLFERAARLRDGLRSLEGMAGRQHALVSAVDALDVVAACPSRQPSHLELFLFHSGLLVEQRSLPRDSLRPADGALATARALLRRRSAADTTAGETEIEPALLDQLFIIGRWLRRNSGEGRHFFLPADEEPNFLALRLGAWLREIADELTDAAGRGSEPADTEADLIADWAG